MQALEFLNEADSKIADEAFYELRDGSIACAEKYLELGLHKQHANRAIEGFTTVKVVVTATEWDNFFALRLHHAAQPVVQELARVMKAAMDDSTPKLLNVNEWHLPYITDDYHSNCTKNDLCLISAARCARVSYLNHDNSQPDIQKDLELANRLLKDGHLSPFEHQASPMIKIDVETLHHDLWDEGVTHMDKKGLMWSANFRGWIQHRQLVA